MKLHTHPSWLRYYTRLKDRLKEHNVILENLPVFLGNSPFRYGDVVIGFTSWKTIPKDKWPEVENLIKDFSVKLRAIRSLDCETALR